MENTILMYNNSLNFSLKQTVNNINDLIFNIQSLKQLQINIDEIQSLKEEAQLQVNMACLALLRRYILDESGVGVILFRNLIRKYYPLSDEQILKYENVIYKGVHKTVDNGKFTVESREWYYITNYNVFKRKGKEFSVENKLYKVRYECFGTTVSTYQSCYSHLVSEMLHLNELRSVLKTMECYSGAGRFFTLNYYVDFHDNPQICCTSLAKNEFTKWNWDLVSNIKNAERSFDWLENLLDNNGFFSQLGTENIAKTLTQLQDVVGTEYLITQDGWNSVVEKYEKMGIGLYAYSNSISKEFIIKHQNELDWLVLQRNPYVQWDLELINLFLKKYVKSIPESEWDKHLDGSRAIYSAIKDLLNDSILRDIEKLYEL